MRQERSDGSGQGELFPRSRQTMIVVDENHRLTLHGHGVDARPELVPLQSTMSAGGSAGSSSTSGR